MECGAAIREAAIRGAAIRGASLQKGVAPSLQVRIYGVSQKALLRVVPASQTSSQAHSITHLG